MNFHSQTRFHSVHLWQLFFLQVLSWSRTSPSLYWQVPGLRSSCMRSLTERFHPDQIMENYWVITCRMRLKILDLELHMVCTQALCILILPRWSKSGLFERIGQWSFHFWERKPRPCLEPQSNPWVTFSGKCIFSLTQYIFTLCPHPCAIRRAQTICGISLWEMISIVDTGYWF